VGENGGITGFGCKRRYSSPRKRGGETSQREGEREGVNNRNKKQRNKNEKDKKSGHGSAPVQARIIPTSGVWWKIFNEVKKEKKRGNRRDFSRVKLKKHGPLSTQREETKTTARQKGWGQGRGESLPRKESIGLYNKEGEY